MDEPIDLSIPTDKYFDHVNNCIHYAYSGKTPYTEEQFPQKALRYYCGRLKLMDEKDHEK